MTDFKQVSNIPQSTMSGQTGPNLDHWFGPVSEIFAPLDWFLEDIFTVCINIDG